MLNINFGNDYMRNTSLLFQQRREQQESGTHAQL